MKRFVWLCILFCVTTAFAQPAVEWTRTIVWPQEQTNVFASIQTSDGGYLLPGDAYGGLAVRLNRRGDSTWSRFYEGAVGILAAAEQLPDGGFLLGGMGLVRITAEGDTVWTRRVVSWNIVPVTESTYVVGDVCQLAKVNLNGDILWTRTFEIPYLGLSELDSGRVVSTGEGGFFLVASVRRDSLTWTRRNGFILKTDSTGHELWRREYRIGYTQSFWAARATEAGGLVIGGDCVVDSAVHRGGMIVVRTDTQGDTVWTRMIQDTTTRGYTPWDLELSWDGGIVLAYSQWRADVGEIRADLTKLSSSGDILWAREMTSDWTYWHNYVRQTADGGYLVTCDLQLGGGNPFDRGYVVKLAPDYPLAQAEVTPAFLDYGYYYPGEIGVLPLQIRNSGSTLLRVASVSQTGNLISDTTGFHGPVWLEPNADTTIQVVFHSTSMDPYRDTVWVLCNSNPSAIPVIALANGASAVPETKPELPLTCRLYDNYPNPFNPTTTISFDLPHAGNVKLSVFDVTGRCVTTLADGEYNAGHHSLTFDGGSLSSGVYFYRMETGSSRESKKMVLLK